MAAVLGLTGMKAIGGLAGAAQAAPVLAGYAAERFSPQGRALAEENRRAAERLRKGEFGFSKGQKREMLGGAVRGIQSATKGLEADLRRQAAAAGGFGRSGAQQAALGEIAGQQSEAAAQASGRIEAMSSAEAQRQRSDTVAALKEARERKRAATTDIAGEVLGAAITGRGVTKKLKSEALKAATGEGGIGAKFGVAEALDVAAGDTEELRRLKELLEEEERRKRAADKATAAAAVGAE